MKPSEEMTANEIAIATVADLPREAVRKMLLDRSVAGRATLARILAGALHRPFPPRLTHGSPEWREWCEAANTAVTVAAQARAAAIGRRRRLTTEDRAALRALALHELELLDIEDSEHGVLGTDWDKSMMAVRYEEARAAAAVLALVAQEGRAP